MRLVSNAIAGVGLLFWIFLPVQIVRVVTGRDRP
jgi:hypothetical protein